MSKGFEMTDSVTIQSLRELSQVNNFNTPVGVPVFDLNRALQEAERSRDCLTRRGRLMGEMQDTLDPDMIKAYRKAQAKGIELEHTLQSARAALGAHEQARPKTPAEVNAWAMRGRELSDRIAPLEELSAEAEATLKKVRGAIWLAMSDFAGGEMAGAEAERRDLALEIERRRQEISTRYETARDLRDAIGHEPGREAIENLLEGL